MDIKETHEYKQMEKVVTNMVHHYKNNWPFRYPETTFQRLLWSFMDFRWARKMLGGRFIQGEICWLWVTSHFDADMEKYAKSIEEYE